METGSDGFRVNRTQEVASSRPTSHTTERPPFLEAFRSLLSRHLLLDSARGQVLVKTVREALSRPGEPPVRVRLAPTNRTRTIRPRGGSGHWRADWRIDREKLLAMQILRRLQNR